MKRHFIIALILSVTFIYSCTQKQEQKSPLVEQEVEYIVEGTTLKGYLVYNENGDAKKPGILVVHEWWGLNNYARNRARMLAELGYVALALDMFGDGKQANHPEDAQKFAMALFSNVQMAEARFTAAYDFIKSQKSVDKENIGAIGYCFGGGIVLHMARAGLDLKAVVSFHGGIEAVKPAEEGKVKSFILVCNGAADPFVNAAQIDTFKAEMEKAKVQYKFVNYEDAKHSFTNPGADSMGTKFNMPLVYNEKADKESWQEMKNLFERVFSK